MDKKNVHIGIIGTGAICRKHIEAYQSIGVDVMAAADINEESLKTISGEYNIPRTFNDYHKLLELKELNAVSICLPVFLHVNTPELAGSVIHVEIDRELVVIGLFPFARVPEVILHVSP